MKKLLILLFIVSLLSNACKKQALESGHPLIGKWKLNEVELIDQCEAVAPATPDFESNPVTPLKTIVEINSSGDIVVRLGDESEKLKFVSINQTHSTTKFNHFNYAQEEYICKVKNKKGEKFTFRFYFKEDKSEMIGTYWRPDHPYHTKDLPNYANLRCAWSSGTKMYYNAEYFASYTKL